MTTQEAAIMIGDRVTALRKAQGIRQAELARRSRLFPQTVNRIERGKRSPDLVTLCSLIVGLDVPADELTGPVCEQLRAERDAA